MLIRISRLVSSDCCLTFCYSCNLPIFWIPITSFFLYACWSLEKFRLAVACGWACTWGQRLNYRRENIGSKREVVEEGFEGHFRREVSCRTSRWWTGTLRSANFIYACKSISLFFDLNLNADYRLSTSIDNQRSHLVLGIYFIVHTIIKHAGDR